MTERVMSGMWYAIRTEAGQEETIMWRIRSLMQEELKDYCRVLYCIKKKRYLGQWHDKRERFLPGYIFWVTEDLKPRNTDRELTTDSQISSLSILSELPGFSAISKGGSGFDPVRQEEEELLIKLTGGNDEIGMSYGVIQDGALKICHGALTGMETRIRKIDRHKRKGYISMKINNKETIAEIGLEITEKTYAMSGRLCSGSLHEKNSAVGKA